MPPPLFSTPASHWVASGRRVDGLLLLFGDRLEFMEESTQGQGESHRNASLSIPLQGIYGVHPTLAPSTTRSLNTMRRIRSSVKSLFRGNHTATTSTAEVASDTYDALARSKKLQLSASRETLSTMAQCLKLQSSAAPSTTTNTATKVTSESKCFTLFTMAVANRRPFGPGRRPLHETFVFGPPPLELDSSVDNHQSSKSPAVASAWVQNWVDVLRPTIFGFPPCLPSSWTSLSKEEEPCAAPTKDVLRVPKRILVVLNPFSGTKKALSIYENCIAPMFALAGIQATMKQTERPMHAYEIAYHLPLDQYDGAVTVSGDGLFHEFVNGFLNRPDFKHVRSFPIGIIPAGSGNALAKSIDTPFPDLAALNIIKSASRPFDVFAVTQYHHDGSVAKRVYGFLEFMWALVADVDLESEKIRWAGSARFTLWAVARVLFLRKYRAKLHYLAAEEKVGVEENAIIEGETEEEEGEERESAMVEGVSPGRIPSHWKTVDSSEFSYFMAMNVPWCSTDVQPAPEARLSDGALDLVWMEGVGRRQVLRFLLDTESGTYIQEPYVCKEKVRAFLLEPDPQQPYGILDLDGERIPYLATLVQVLPRRLTLLAPREHDEHVWWRNIQKTK